MSRELAPIATPATEIVLATRVDLLEAFLRGRKPTTLRAYDGDLKHFATFLGVKDARGKPDPRAAVAFLLSRTRGEANGVALSYRNSMLDRKPKPLNSATVARRLAALRSIVKLARTLGECDWALDVEAPKVVPYRDTRGPGDEGWSLMLARAKVEARTSGEKGKRDLALLRVLHDLALRRAEVVNLDLASVDIKGHTLEVVGKGATDPVLLTLPDPTLAALVAWIETRGDWQGPLFYRLDRAAESRERLTTEGVYYLVTRLGRRAGVEKPVWPHALRHQAITSALDRTNGDVRSVQRYSRHCDLRTLTRYDDNRRDVAGDVAKKVAGD